MGVRMMVEILDHAPPELSPAERLVLIAIAEDARDGGDRTCSPGVDMLCRRTGLSEEGLRKVFQRLAKHGLEIRVALGKGKSGRLVFAKPGVRTTYRIPVFVADEAGEWRDGEPEVRDESTAIKAVQASQSDGMAVQASRVSGREAQNSGREYRPSPSSPSSPTTQRDAGEEDGGLFAKPEPRPKKTPAKKATPVPADFPITDEMRAYAAEKTPLVDIEFQTEQFLLHHGSKGTTHKDWKLAWMKWMRNQQQWDKERQPGQSHLRVVSGQHHDPRYAKGTGSYVDPNTVYTDDPAVVFGTTS